MQSLVDQPIESDEDNNEEMLPEDEQPMPSSAVTRYDIGTLTAEHLIPREVEVAVKFRPKPYPQQFPRDVRGCNFPVSIF